MKLESTSIQDGKPIPAEFAMGVPGDAGPVPGPNRNPHLRWSDVPAGTRSFAVFCVDVDVPTKPDDVNRAGTTVPYDLPRADFFHWVMVDVPANVSEIPAGADSEGVIPRGKRAGETPLGVRGINSYTDWFKDDPNMRGDYGGYDGPWPPFNDERIHHYVFTVYAVDTPSLGLPVRFTGDDALRAMEGHVLAKASIQGTYALYPHAR
jgi:Raf kinase inhibitor-like YbhB/YbcL family protein